METGAQASKAESEVWQVWQGCAGLYQDDVEAHLARLGMHVRLQADVVDVRVRVVVAAARDLQPQAAAWVAMGAGLLSYDAAKGLGGWLLRHQSPRAPLIRGLCS